MRYAYDVSRQEDGALRALGLRLTVNVEDAA
jgi:hypothetical protein